MDIYIRTADVRLGRALALEARAAGFSAAFGREAADARLTVCDLDSAADGPSGDIAFSRDEERLRAAARQSADADTLFLLYPFDLALFRAQLAARLTAAAPTPLPRALTLNTATRRVGGAGGEVRLSVRECAMLAALGRNGALSRADAAALFGSAAGNVVDVYACYLRKKLGRVLPGEVICARRGEGYALADDVTLEVL